MDTLACAEATCLWLTEKFTSCHATLQKLESEGKSDLKLAHNLLVVEHAVTGSAEADRIASQLELISNDKLTADDGSGTAASGATDVSAAAAAGSSRSRSSSNLEPLPLVPVRDDLAIAQLNRAILLYHQHRYASAASLLEPLATTVEALAEGTAVRVLTLLLEIFIEGRQLPRAVAVLHRLERLYGTLAESYAADRSAELQQETHAIGSSLSTGGASNSGGDGNAGVGAGGNVVPARGGSGGSFSGGNGGSLRPRALALPRVSRWCTGAMERSKALLDTTDRPLAAPDLKLLIKLYRSRLHALAHNTRAAKRELKAVISALQQQQLCHTPSGAQAPLNQPATQGQEGHATQEQASTHHHHHHHHQHGGALVAASPAAEALLLAVQAQLELYRGRTRKATKLLLAMLQDPTFSESHRPLLLNDLGLVHHQQGKHTLALLYFSQALAAEGARGSEPSATSQKPEPEASGHVAFRKAGVGPDSSQTNKSQQLSQPAQQPCALATVPTPAVMYNAGLQHLMLHNYEAARKCFAAAASHYLNTPLLWLRTGEAALGLYRRYQEEQEQQRRQRLFSERGGTVLAPAAGGVDRLVERILLGPGGSAVGPASIPTGGSGAALDLRLQPRRLVLPTGAPPSPADADPAAAELLSEAVVALQTALQQLDAQQEAHDQWQSSSSKLEEGLLPAPLACGLAATPAAGVASTGGVANGGGGGGAGNSGGGGGASQPGLPAASGGSIMTAGTGAAERYLPLVSQQQQFEQPQQQQQIDYNPQSRPGLSNGTGVGGSSGEEARHSPQLPHLENGIHEQQGTDASAALAEELCAIRRAVLANLAYAHLQAEDWCAALQAAKALLAVSTLAGPATAGSGVAGAGLAAAEYAFLAHNYAAEALCYLDRPADAVEYLSLWLMTAQEREGQAQTQSAARIQKSDEDGAPGVSTSCGSREDGEQYALGNAGELAALSGPVALAATATNLGAVFASQGELDQATALVRQALTLQPGSRSAVLLLVYCELAAGNTPVALALLKQHGQPVPR